MLRFTVNSTEVALPDVPVGESLLNTLRNRCGLRGTKNACEEGECGSCLVDLDGRTACSCLVPAHQVHGRAVTTIEGLSPANGDLDTIQQAFLDTGAVQCGFCTPGFVVAVHALLDEHADPDPEQTREALAGNLCRCTGYHAIFDAVMLAAERRRGVQP